MAHGLYAELISGTAFTAPRTENRRSWLYRRQPAVVKGCYQPYAQSDWTSGVPDRLRWSPFSLPDASTNVIDFIDGLHTVAPNGEVDHALGA